MKNDWGTSSRPKRRAGVLKTIALIATGLVLVGVAGTVVTAAVQHQSLSNYMTSAIEGRAGSNGTGAGQSYDQTKSVDGQSVQSIQVNVEAASVHLHPGTTSNIVAHASGRIIGINPNEFTFTVTKNGNQVVVSFVKKHNFSIGFNSMHMNIDVVVPQQVYQQLSAQSSAGNLTINDLEAKSFTLHSNAGSVNGSNLTGAVQAGSNAGSVILTGVQGDVDLQSNAGSVKVSGIDGSVRAHSSAGSVDVKVDSITHDITADSNAGSVRVTAAQAPSALQFRLQASVGSVQFGLPNASFTVKQKSVIEGSIGQGGPMLDLQSSVGSVDVVQGPVS